MYGIQEQGTGNSFYYLSSETSICNRKYDFADSGLRGEKEYEKIRKQREKIFALLGATGIIAGSTLPTYAAIANNAAVEQNAVARSETGQAYQGDIIALDDIGVSIQVSDYTAIRQEDGFVYIYTMADESIPYVIIGKYDSASINFVNEFTKYMADSYSDLQVVEDIDTVELGGRIFTEIGYTYTAGGCTVRDRRLFSAKMIKHTCSEQKK